MGAYLGLQLPYGALLADVLLRPAQPVYLPRYFRKQLQAENQEQH